MEALKVCIDHDCLDHLSYREHEWVETHGLDCGPYEHCWQEWWECAICGEKLTERERAELAREAMTRAPVSLIEKRK
jgi:hypothetical protein